MATTSHGLFLGFGKGPKHLYNQPISYLIYKLQKANRPLHIGFNAYGEMSVCWIDPRGRAIAAITWIDRHNRQYCSLYRIAYFAGRTILNGRA